MPITGTHRNRCEAEASEGMLFGESKDMPRPNNPTNINSKQVVYLIVAKVLLHLDSVQPILSIQSIRQLC